MRSPTNSEDRAEVTAERSLYALSAVGLAGLTLFNVIVGQWGMAVLSLVFAWFAVEMFGACNRFLRT